MMGLLKILRLCILCCSVFSLVCSRTGCLSSELSVKFLKAPHAFSRLSSAAFAFEVQGSGNGSICTNFSLSCKLDDGIASACETRKVTYSKLQDGNHTFEVCINRTQGLGCASYNWTVDTVPPTAYITASTSFTSALNVSVNITFTEPCIGGGIGCASVNACNLLVYGAGQVIPSSFSILQPNVMYSLLISLSPMVQYGRAILVMDKNFCTDIAGNSFTRAPNSTVYVHFDRRRVYVNLRTHVPERLLQLDNETRTVQATNDCDKLRVCVNFSAPVLNSSTEIMKSLNITQGSLLPINGKSLGSRRFGFLIANISATAIISIGLNSESIISRQGTQFSPIAPVTFLCDSKRPAVKLSTYTMRTKHHNVQILIKFLKPVLGFNSSSISMSGGHLKSFHEMNRSKYMIELQADDDLVFVSVPENVTSDVAGNRNLASNVLQVRHYSTPITSSLISGFATASFLLTSLAAGLLTISTASLQSVGAFMRSSSFLTADPARNLFRTIYHIQIFALSRWLAVNVPVEFYEFSRNLRWTIPYFCVPWETGDKHMHMLGPSPFRSSNSYINKVDPKIPSIKSENNLNIAASVYRSPLTASEYQSYIESQNMQPEAEYILDSQRYSEWTDFYRSIFWLAVICGGLILLHAFFLFILKLRKKSSEKQSTYGALTFPRFEIFLIFFALPSICKASAVLLRGGAPSAVVVGILLLVFVSFALLSLFLFLSVGITFGKLLQYKEVHQEVLIFHWYQELIRVTLGPGKRGQWTWKDQPSTLYLTIFGPLFEDLRGPPKYMLSQIAGSNSSSRSHRIIASDDETEDAEAPFIQKLFGILRIYYVLLESIRRVSLGLLAGAYKDTRSSQTPTIIQLSMSSFQLFFLLLKKPLLKKKVQLVEIISLACEVGLFATFLVLLRKDFSVRSQTEIGIFMPILFLVGYSAQIINEWNALYRQTRRLDPEDKSFFRGLKIASIGFLLYFIPKKYFKNLERGFPRNGGEGGETGNVTLSADRNSGSRNSGSSDRPWLKQLRELAKASFGREESGGINDPSTSNTRSSRFWRIKRSGSSSLGSSSDYKSRPSRLYKDLEAIFASSSEEL